MRTLRDLQAAYAPLLLIDAASTKVQVGWLAKGEKARWATSTEEAGVGIFRVLAELGADPDSCGAFLYCDGPGSILGVRTAAITIRTFNVLQSRPVFAYHSLALVAANLEPTTKVIADARRDSWHCFSEGKLQRVPTGELKGTFVTPENFRHWSPPPAGTSTTTYEVSALLERAGDMPLFRPTEDPDAFLHEEPSYVTWTPRVHRAP